MRLAIIFVALIVGCTEFPTDYVSAGSYNGSWIGVTDVEVLQLNIKHEYSSVTGGKLTGNG